MTHRIGGEMAIQDQLTIASQVAGYSPLRVALLHHVMVLSRQRNPSIRFSQQIARLLHLLHQRQILFTGGDRLSSSFDRLLNEDQRLSAFRHHLTSSAFFVLNVTVFSPGTRLAAISQTSEPPELGTIAKK